MNNIARILLATIVLAGSHQARGDDGGGTTITGRYWFDNSTTHTAFTPGSMEIATDGLSVGLHTLNAYVEHGGKISSVASRCFLKIPPVAAVTPQIRLAVDGTPLEVVTASGSNGVYSFDLNTSGVKEGLHQLRATADFGGTLSPTVSQWFLKTFGVKPGEKYKTTVFIDGKPLQTYDTQASDGGVMSLSLDANSLPLGIHTLQAQVVSTSGVATDVKTAMFMRVPSTAQISTMKGYYTVDGKLTGEIDAAMNGNTFNFDFDASQLTPGLHSLSVYLASGLGLTTSVKTAWFIKIPLGGEGVKSYEYWINDNVASVKRVALDKVADPFELISLVEIDEEPFRSTSYTFAIEEGVPVTYARNDFQVRFSDSEGRISMAGKQFSDTRTRRAVTDIERIAATEATLRPNPTGANAIKWYQFEAEAGDSLALRFDRSVGYEVYAPDATLMLQASGADAVANRGVGLTQTGTHYIAVHDVANGGTPTMQFTHIPRFAILEVKPPMITSSGSFILVDLFGNGMLSATSLIIDNGEGANYETTDFSALDNYHLGTTITLDEPIPTGTYDVTLVVNDTVTNTEQRITKVDAMTVTEAGESAKIDVKVQALRQPGTPYMVDIRVTNNSNVPCWGIPVNIACERDGGINDFVFYMNDFKGEQMSADFIDRYETDNLLGTGTDGVFCPLILSYLQPHETRTLQVGIISEPHKKVGIYAWAGTPFSEEAKQLMSMPADSLIAQPLYYSNMFNLRTAAYILQALEEYNASQPSKVRARAPGDGGCSSSCADDYGPNSTGQYRTLSNSAGLAEQTYNVYNGYAQAHAGIVNSGPGYHSYMYFKHQAGIPGSTLGEQVANIESMYRTTDPDELPADLKYYYLQAKKTLGRCASPEDIASDFLPDWVNTLRSFLKRNAESPNPMPTRNNTEVLMSGDPNDMHGYTAPSGDRHIGVGVKTVNYTIEFENDPEIANAPASVIKVDNTLDGKRLDLGSFKPLKMIIGDKETELPAGHHFVKTLDMRPGISSVAELTFDYDATTGTAKWSIRSLDPMTMEPTKYMDDGVLPVNDESGRGTGYLIYSIDLLPDLPDGATIDNSATIVFDDNEPIATPVYTNITDYTLPTSAITEKTTADNLTFDFTVEGEDSGSGIWFYDLYMRPAGSTGWILVKSQIESTQFSFTSASPLEGADFVVLATDRAGNRQDSEVLTAMLGDADGNGKIDANDVVAIRNYYTGESVTIRRVSADVSLDGKIDTQDATATRNLYLAEHIKNKIQKSRRK